MFIYELKPIYENVKSYYGKAIIKEDTDFNKSILELYSYETKVAVIIETFTNDYGIIKEVFVTKNNDHLTNTTLRHIKEFLRQDGFNAQNKKYIINNYMELH